MSIRMILESQQTDRVYISPPAQGEDHISHEGTGGVCSSDEAQFVASAGFQRAICHKREISVY
jgi:hypothetical protein